MGLLRLLDASIGVLILSSALAACEQHEPLDVAPVQLSRLQGRWYEIAKLARPSQAGCSGTTADYRVESGNELLIVNQCHEGGLNGPVKRAAARAVASDPSVPAKLSLDFGMAYGDFWILEVDEQYSYTVVGHPSREYLWILSRTPALPRETLDGVLARAQSRGFPIGILSYTEQAP
jgi:apolipoprotein D and lipocalin family protein